MKTQIAKLASIYINSKLNIANNEIIKSKMPKIVSNHKINRFKNSWPLTSP